MDKAELFRRAHKTTKAVIAKFGGNYHVTFGCALSNLWNEISEEAKTVRFQINTWFLNKNADKLTTAHCHVSRYFGKEDIIKETEKAYQVNLELVTNNTGADTAYTKLVWVPKSCVEIYAY